MSDERKYLCETVKMLAAAAREAGVIRLSTESPVGRIDIELAPASQSAAPRPATSQRGVATRLADFHAKTMKQRHDTLFAATSVKPTFTPPAPPQSAVPRAVRDRRAANGEDAAE